MNFDAALQFGKIGEGRIARWMRAKGWHVLPVYEQEIDAGKGPVFFQATGEPLICADIFAFKDAQHVRWIEAKRKSAFTWHRITGRWVTGINLRHYLDYVKLADLSPFSFWLLFLQERGEAKDTPGGMVSPAGLFGQDMKVLRSRENHRHEGNGASMVYWADSSLHKLAELNDMP